MFSPGLNTPSESSTSDQISEPVTETLLRLRSTVLTTTAKVETTLAHNPGTIRTYNEFKDPMLNPLHLWDPITESNPQSAITRLRTEIGWSEEELQAYLLRAIEDCTKYADLLIELDQVERGLVEVRATLPFWERALLYSQDYLASIFGRRRARMVVGGIERAVVVGVVVGLSWFVLSQA
ncbi:uncharacterized protein BDV14DRAFT_205137 [Aspergillus stella-maris]|uniref:uncharacterized protein n=1 Tax=Aspergillus stella-maris TaxID=1810926 RepID=UPI003CCDD0E5